MMDQKLPSFLSLNSQEALVKLQSSEHGLTSKEAKSRLSFYGRNDLVGKRGRPVILEALSHSLNPLVAILLIAALIAAFTGSPLNAGIIISIVLLSIGLDYFQSHRSLTAAKRLRAKVTMTATVLRDDQWQEVSLPDVVPGDIIHLSAGDMIPADAMLMSAKDFHVQQSALTGESLPLEKAAIQSQPQTTEFTSATNLIFAGTSVVSGIATAVVLVTGKNTLFGQIAATLSVSPPRTEFEKGINRFGFFIMKTVVFLILFVFAVTALFKYNPIESLLFAVALAVGLTPEFLPMIVTVTLAKGAINMSHKGVIVKNLAAIQNFGSIDILCSDKTGTLTQGKMVLEKCLDAYGNPSEQVLLLAYLNSLFESEVHGPIKAAILHKTDVNPLDAAILRSDHPDVQPYHKIDEIPFDFERRRSSIVVDKSGEQILIAKGAPESILEICQFYRENAHEIKITEAIHAQCQSLFATLSAQGYRLLAVAYRKVPPQPAYTIADEKELVFAGYLVFYDPPLKEAGSIISKLRHENVIFKILTGDNDLVAKHVAQQVGFDAGEIIVGSEIDKMSDAQLAIVAEKTAIFARVSPIQKQRIIKALRSHSHVLGYIGDGINDAPSLHSADVGISVANAVDVAKEAASIILLKKHLNVILHGIVEGRKSFGNVMKYLMMGTSSNFGNMFSMAAAVLFLPFLPMLPSQILLNNLLYDFAQVTIPSDKVDPIFIQKPRRWNINIIRKFMLYIGPISSIFDFLTFIIMLVVFHAAAPLFQTGWFVESLATQTLVIFIIRTAKNPFRSRPSMALICSVFLMVGIGIFLPYSPLAKLFGFVPLPVPFFIFLIIATILYLFLVELVKRRLMWKWLSQEA